MSGRTKVGAVSALVLVGLAAAGCKQPARPAATPAAPASSTADSGVLASPGGTTTATSTGAAGKADFRAARRQMKEACRADIQTLCGGGGGDVRPAKCLRGKLDQLKPECRQALEAMIAERKEGRGARAGR